MAGTQNLIPKDSNQSREEAKKNGRKGGIKSGEVRRKRKTLRQLALMLGQLKVTGKTAEQMKAMGIDVDDQIRDTAMLISLQQKALTGDVQAVKLLAQMQGDLIEKTEIGGMNGEPIQVDAKVGVKLDDIIAALKS